LGGVVILIRIKLLVSDARYDELERELAAKGFVIDEDAELILTEKDLFADHLIVRSNSNNERVRISTDEIIVIESFGHDIVIHTLQGQFKTGERLYQLERLLHPQQFLRISNSVIIARNKIKRIIPALSSKFVLTMSNGQNVDVTRSYYSIFKDRLGI
jgi:DNA-binding LytR/AlgR family response regulator